MNPRIFKKLTKKAAVLIEQIHDLNGLNKVVTGADSYDIEDTGCWVDSFYRDEFGCFDQLDGTVGFGGLSGYYKPEWSDEDALSMLYGWYIELHCDYSEYPKYVTSLAGNEHTWQAAVKFANEYIKVNNNG